MLDAQQHYEAGMEEADYMASETDETCATCGKALKGWEVESDELDGTCYLCLHRPACYHYGYHPVYGNPEDLLPY